MTLQQRLARQRQKRAAAVEREKSLAARRVVLLARLSRRPKLGNALADLFDLRITSTYRTPQHNKDVGGVPNSWHTKGRGRTIIQKLRRPAATDFVGTERDMQAAARHVEARVPNVAEILIHNVGSGRHLHIGGWGVADWDWPADGELKANARARRRSRRRARRAEGRIKHIRLVLRLRRHGARHVEPILAAADRIGVPRAWALALVEQESAFKNIFGGDHGKLSNPFIAPFFRVPVTKVRVAQLLQWVAEGNASNGVGLTQLTDRSLILAANAAGGAHKITPQLVIGLTHLKNRAAGNYSRNAWRYNGRRSYQQEIAPKHAKWAQLV